MRRYIPFGHGAAATTSASASDDEPPAQTPTDDNEGPQPSSPQHRNQEPSQSDLNKSNPDSSPRTYLLPSVPALPSVRKYLFSSASTTPSNPHSPTHGNELRRRLSGHAAHNSNDTSPRRPSSSSSSSLPEFTSMVEGALGPVGQPKDPLLKRMTGDRLVDALNASAQERERLLLQFLRARHHNAQEALLMLTKTLRWRKSVNIEHYLAQSTRNMIKPTACFPMHIISSPDRCKQPVVYGLIRLLDKRKAERIPFQNALLSFLESAYFGENYVEDAMVIWLDFREWSIRRNAPYRLVKDGIQTLQDYYPERLGRVFLVNYPTSIRAAYTAISPIIDAGAKEKLVWVGDSDPSATARRYVSPKSIPTFLGGELDATFPSTWPDIAEEFGATSLRARVH